MKARMKKIRNIIILLTFTYAYGFISGIVFQIMCWFGFVRVSYWERFPKWQENMIIVSNHPSVVDPFLLSALFFREYLVRPLKYCPYNVPDKGIFYDPWYFFWLRPIMIPVKRTGERTTSVFYRIKRLLQRGKRIIIFPEGGRTFKGKHFLYSEQGKKIRKLIGGIGHIIANASPLVVPIWIEGSDHVFRNSEDTIVPKLDLSRRIVIRIGKPMDFSDHSNSSSDRELIIQEIVEALLELADEEE